ELCRRVRARASGASSTLRGAATTLSDISEQTYLHPTASRVAPRAGRAAWPPAPTPRTMNAMRPASRPYPWKTFAFLVAAGTLTGPLAIPYFLGLQAIAPGPQPAVPLGQLVFFTIAHSFVLLVPAAGLGLLVARRIGLGAPYLESWLARARPFWGAGSAGRRGRPSRCRRSYGRRSSGRWSRRSSPSASTPSSSTRSASTSRRLRSTPASPSPGGVAVRRASGLRSRRRSSIVSSYSRSSHG